MLLTNVIRTLYKFGPEQRAVRPAQCRSARAQAWRADRRGENTSVSAFAGVFAGAFAGVLAGALAGVCEARYAQGAEAPGHANAATHKSATCQQGAAVRAFAVFGEGDAGAVSAAFSLAFRSLHACAP